jgi:phosphatidylglycerol:prolipoprotein diacylglycerol transferase
MGNGILIPVYNLLIGVGAIFGFLHLEKEIKCYNVDFRTNRNIYLSLIVSIFLGFVGAKLFELFYHGYELNLYAFASGGITFMGGLMTGAICFFTINAIVKTNNLLAFNLLVPFIIISHFWGRIGCFFAGCCYGKPTDSIFGVIYPNDSLPALHFETNISLHPTQLYEACLLALLFVVIMKIKFHFRISVYLIGYGILRFFIEFFRADDRGQVLISFLTPSQLLSFLFILIGIISYYKTNFLKGQNSESGI